MRGHVESMRIARRDGLILARDFERFAFAAWQIVGVDEIVHRARVIEVPLVNAEENLGRAIGVLAGNGI